MAKGLKLNKSQKVLMADLYFRGSEWGWGETGSRRGIGAFCFPRPGWGYIS